METIRVALVDDQKLFRQSFSALLSAFPEYELIMDAEHGLDCLYKINTMPVLPHIILVDMEMPVMDGIILNEQLQKLYPDIKRIILSVYAKEDLIARVMEAGASGYLIKNCDKEELCTAINSVFTKGFYMDAHIMKTIQNTPVKNRVVQTVF